jgi:signal transduction histidine kinase/putative methionine-R-sulfoxide reductase with GAF domain
MARSSGVGGKKGAAKTRKAKGSNPGKTRRRTAPSAIRSKRSLASALGIELKEAREQQAATSEVLEAINRSGFDLDKILQTLVSTAARLCKTGPADIFLLEGDVYRFRAGQNLTEAYREHEERAEIRAGLGTLVGRVALTKGVVRIVDALEDTEYEDKEAASANNFRSMLGVPLLRDGEPVGVFALARTRVQPFSESQIRLVTTFANQAVIAIENTRLFNETHEALERQTATADILKVIAGSPTDVQPVFDAIAKSARRLLGSHTAVVTRVIDDVIHLAASTAEIEAPAHAAQGLLPYPLSSDRIHARVARTGQLAVNTDAPNSDLPREIKEFARTVGWRSMLVVPMLRNGIAIGTIGITRREAGSFNSKTIDLLKIFADQAVIAIENTRLFNEVQAKTRDLTEALTYQTGSANILNVIASSPTDIEPVLNAIVEGACRLCEANDAAVLLKDGEHLRFRAHHGPIDINLETFPITRGWTAGRAFLDGKPVHLRDTQSEDAKEFPDSRALALPPYTNFSVRTVLSVPLLRESERVGVILLRRIEMRPFSDKQIALLQTFADQAVIAINNARLFDEVQAKTRELEQSLDDLRAAQDRLVQTEKLASLGQLTAGIAHEIKNPLNFVNNFAALSVELTDELVDLLRQAALVDKMRGEVGELTGLLRDNLSKVVQHGGRADAIVKNMLLHSRQGSGERRLADINALVGESLNLAYHGARAEKTGFEITLKHDFDSEAGAVDLYPQEITRALLNLISNGFYAATKRKLEAGDGTFEPVLSMTTRNLGRIVEIRIRDNGTGIPREIREKIFNPFFTTKPTGEGTGLGLSMTHDIIVKQHGGRIDVETEPGSFTEFIITLPRDYGNTRGEKPE